jgi:tripeptidyl-peptidase-1
MKASVLAIVVGLAAYASAAPASTHVVHERRVVQLDKWARRDIKLNRDAVIPMSIGLTQRNLDNGYDFLMDVSDPRSANYGKHWSFEQVQIPYISLNPS